MAELPLAAGLMGLRNCKLSPKPPPPPALPLPARRRTHATATATTAPSPRRAVPELHSTTGKCYLLNCFPLPSPSSRSLIWMCCRRAQSWRTGASSSASDIKRRGVREESKPGTGMESDELEPE